MLLLAGWELDSSYLVEIDYEMKLVTHLKSLRQIVHSSISSKQSAAADGHVHCKGKMQHFYQYSKAI